MIKVWQDHIDHKFSVSFDGSEKDLEDFARCLDFGLDAINLENEDLLEFLKEFVNRLERAAT